MIMGKKKDARRMRYYDECYDEVLTADSDLHTVKNLLILVENIYRERIYVPPFLIGVPPPQMRHSILLYRV